MNPASVVAELEPDVAETQSCLRFRMLALISVGSMISYLP